MSRVCCCSGEVLQWLNRHDRGAVAGCWDWQATPDGPFDVEPFQLAFDLVSLLGSACYLDGKHHKADA